MTKNSGCSPKVQTYQSKTQGTNNVGTTFILRLVIYYKFQFRTFYGYVFYFSAIHRFQEVLYHPRSAYQHDNFREARSQQCNSTSSKTSRFQIVLEVKKKFQQVLFVKGMTISRNYVSAEWRNLQRDLGISRHILTPRAVIWLSHLSSEILDGSSRAKEKVLLQGPNNYNSAITDQTLFPWPCPQLEEQLWLFWLKAQAAKVSLSAGATRSWRLRRIRDSFAIK